MQKYFFDQCGASASEYALLLAIIGVGLGLAMLSLGGTVNNAMTRAGNCVGSTSGTC